MIDFHSHILPNIDDGSKSIDETLNLIKEAKAAGFTAVIATPHYIEDYYNLNREKTKRLFNSIEKQCDDIDLYLGNEIYITDDIYELLKNECASSINATNYVLFELPFNVKPMNLDNVVYDMLAHKLIPILAHPERYSFVQDEPELVYELVNKGVLMQSNYGSITGQYGKKAKLIVKEMLENDLVHFLGTDVHKQNSIYPEVPRILQKIEKLIGKERLRIITTINPMLALENKRIDILEPKEIKLSITEKILLQFTSI